jgi:hypothetical protein
MEVNKQLRKQIIIEIFALSFLVFSILYGIFAIGLEEATVFSQDGMVIVYDNESFKAIESFSDGEGLNTDGIKYTVTNNNSKEYSYKLILYVNEDKELLEYIRVGIDDLYVDSLLNLDRYKDGYVLNEATLDAGYTRIHNIKMWYKLDVDQTIADKVIDYRLELVKEDK